MWKKPETFLSLWEITKIARIGLDISKKLHFRKEIKVKTAHTTTMPGEM